MRPQVFAALSLALFLLPAALVAAQGGPPAAEDAASDQANPTRTVTFYPHVYAATAALPMPGNTQFPWGEDDFSAGYPGNGCFPEAARPLSAVPAIPPQPVPTTPFVARLSFPTCEDWANNNLYVYSTAGFVHVDPDSWSYEQFHNERGQAKDILLDTTQDITATFYMSADWHGWNCGLSGSWPTTGVPSPYPCWNWDPGFFPRWQVEATLMLGSMGEYQGQASDAPPVHEKVLSGDVVQVAWGESAPQDVLSLDSSLNSGQGEVYEFNINLGKPQVDKIPREMDWIMRFRWWIRQDDGTKIIPGQRFNWNINSGEFYPNRFTLPVKNPFDVELVFPQFLHDKLLIHAMLNSPWGSYDVDSKTVGIDIVDDTGRPIEMVRAHRVADFSVAHGGHYKPVNITWVWDYKGDQLRPGTYRVTVTASNYQHSATSSTTASFRINPDGSGTVLSVGRSGQQTFTEAQLRAIESGTATTQSLPAEAPPALSPSESRIRQQPGFEPLLALAAVAAMAAAARRLRP